MSAPRDDDEVNAASDGEGAVDAQIELLTSLKNPELNALVDAHKASSSAATAATAPVTTPAPSAAPLASAAAAIRAAASTAPGGAAAPSSSSTKASKHKALTIAMGGGHSLEEAEQLDASHRFWSTQPVPHMADRGGGEQHRPLEGPTADVRAEPSRLPAGFEWTVIDVTSDAQLLEMYKVRAHEVERAPALAGWVGGYKSWAAAHARALTSCPPRSPLSSPTPPPPPYHPHTASRK